MPETVRCQDVNTQRCWHVAAACRATFEAWLARHGRQLPRQRGSVIKEDAATRVCVLDGFVVKTYKPQPGIEGLLKRVSGHRARLSYTRGRALQLAGVPVAESVAWSVVRKRGLVVDQILVTREVPRARPLHTWLSDPTLTEAQRASTLEQLGRLVGRVHRAGFSNRDLKDGNFLLAETGAEGMPRLVAIDMDGCKHALWMTRRRVRRDFLPVCHSLSIFGWDRPDDVQRMLDAYRLECGRNIAPDTLPVTVRTPVAHPPGWACARRTIRRSGGGRLTFSIYHPANEPAWVQRVLLYQRGTLAPLLRKASSAFAQVHFWTDDATGKAYVFKQFRLRSRIDGLKHVVRASRARRALNAHLIAMARGLDVPRVFCLVETRRTLWRSAGLLVTEAVENAITLADLVNAPGEAGASAHIPDLAVALGRETGRWHAVGLVHGDMRHGNVFCRKSQTGWRFILIDNERTRLCTRRHERARNLVQLNMCPPGRISLRDRVRFWRAYAATMPGGRIAKRALRDTVVAWTLRRWREKSWQVER